MKTQKQYYYGALSRSSGINKHFMELLRNSDITKKELGKLIEKRPEAQSLPE